MRKVGETVAPGKEGLQMRTCLHQIGLGPCLWSTSVIADWLEGARTKQVGVGCVKRLADHEPKTKLEKNVPWFVLRFLPRFP